MRLGVDVDGVLRDMIGGVLHVTAMKSGWKYLMPSQIKSYNFFKTLNIQEKHEEFFRKYANELFLNSKPTPYAYKINDLRGRHNIVIITSQFRGLEDITLDWLDKNNIYYDEIHFAWDKSKIDVDVMIEDLPKNLENMKQNVIKVIYTQPYNKKYHNANYRIKNMHRFVQDVMPQIELGHALQQSIDKDIYNKSIESIIHNTKK